MMMCLVSSFASDNQFAERDQLMRIIENADKEFAAEMHKAAKDNNGYRPCFIEKTPDTKCMWEFREMEEGAHCGLYIKVK